jgi:signal transduction histidine kinase
MTADAELELCVDDEGPGIPAEDRERIFESFFRKRSEPQLKVPGHGLGLATRARSLSSRHIKAQPSTQSGTPRPVPMRA